MQPNVSSLRTDLNIYFDNNDPIVGILMPCYNHAKYIREAINSVIEQDYKNKLLIIIDDKSTDNSVETIKNILFQNQQLLDNEQNKITIGHIDRLPYELLQVILIEKPENKKQAAARNTGIKITWDYCDYYCQLDADDWFLPEKLSKSIDAINNDKDNIGLVYSDVIIENNITNTKVLEFREPFSLERLLQEDIISNQPLINKEALSEVGLYDEGMSPCEDWDLFIRICHKYIAIHIPEFLQKYRVTSQSCTFTVDKSIWQDRWNKIRQRIAARYNA